MATCSKVAGCGRGDGSASLGKVPSPCMPGCGLTIANQSESVYGNHATIAVRDSKYSAEPRIQVVSMILCLIAIRACEDI